MPYRIESAIVGAWEPDGFSPEREQEDARNVALGLGAGRVLAEKHGWDTIWLVTLTERSLTRGRTLAEAIGEGAVRALSAGRPVTFRDRTLRHATLRTLSSRGVQGVIVALYPTLELLQDLDALYVRNAVVVVPYTDNIQDWIDTWGPLDLKTGEYHPQLGISDPVVKAAVDEMVTHMTGVSHPDDKRFAQQQFAKLRRSKKVDPREIQAYVIRETGWGVHAARDLAKIAAGRSRSR